jgi:RNA polymerase sigma-70 factor (ECF subfamily)
MDALVALLHDDIQTTMPPRPTWIRGREANDLFFRRMIPRWRGGLRIVRTAANGRPALALYRSDARESPRTLRAIEVIEIKDGAIARIDHFMTRAAFRVFGLPEEIAQS